ncbi:hypothetical protein C8F01DRAFT_1078135 [Mycena amicta]|nr:hypothetical protein C8F01DRAFT_1078135 [Mycena amicta]
MSPSKLIDILFCVGGLLVAEPDACCHYYRQPFSGSQLKSPTRSIVTAATRMNSDMPVASVSVDSYKMIQLQVHGASDYEQGTLSCLALVVVGQAVAHWHGTKTDSSGED